MSKVKIKRAIISVHNKNHLSSLAKYLIKNNVEILSTGGTARYLRDLDKKAKIIEISQFTEFKEILEGRVKSLHPKIYSGILGKKNHRNHKSQLKNINVPFVDLVVVNLYPFEEVSTNTKSSQQDCIENIDIGGPTLIRAAAKNFEHVVVLSDPAQYKCFIEEAIDNNNSVSLEFRHRFAQAAFENTAHYEATISRWFNKKKKFSEDKLSVPLKKISNLRYGENPHQKAALFELEKSNFTKISGKVLSYNNIYDSEVASELAFQFKSNSCVILKHGNPCGVSLNNNQKTAYLNALKCDSRSAFGGVIAFNSTLSAETAKEIKKIFTEIIIAPNFSQTSKKILSEKENLILIKYKPSKSKLGLHFKTTKNFLLAQDKDEKKITHKDMKVKTKKVPSKKLLDDMIFAYIVSKYLNSNAIVLAEKLSTLGIGSGQTNRLDAAELAIKRMKKNSKTKNAVMASDGFFPFPDIVELCAKNMIYSVIQPGGSKNDSAVIEMSNRKKISMIFTGIRHFKH